MKRLENLRIGLYNDNFKIEKLLHEETIEVEVRGKKSFFNVKCGNLILGGRLLDKTYVVKIHYKKSEEEYRKNLPLGGFGAHIYADYALTAHKIAEDFCKEYELELVNHLNSWPEFQAVLQSERIVNFNINSKA